MTTDLGFIHQYKEGRKHSNTVLLLLHGTGGTEQDLIPLAQELMPEAGILSVRGKVLENGMPRFFRRLAEGVFDLEDLKFRTNELADFLTAARELYGLHKHSFVAVGYSNGANIAASLMLTKPEALRGAVLLRPMIPFQPKASPDLSGVSILLCSGERDPVVPHANAEGLAKIFRSAGADVKVYWHKGGHELGQDDVDQAKMWLTVEVL